eukprot:gene4410-4727_t
MNDILDHLGDSSEESSDEEDDDDLFYWTCFFAKTVRKPKLFRRRWESNYFQILALEEDSFVTEYRMDLARFSGLVSLIRNRNLLNVDMKRAKNSTSAAGSDPITLDSRVGAALIVLGGGRITESMRTHRISASQAYSNLRRVVRAINQLPELAIVCSSDDNDLEIRAEKFKARSSHEMFEFCTGAIDGLAIKIAAPKKVLNQTQYYSGGKQMFCLNVQAVCDADGKILAFSCKHAGSTNDAMAFQTSDLKGLCEAQSFPYHWIGDLAYPLLSSLMTPFAGAGLSEDKDSFNFYLSQLRITIERVFGILVQRWGILWKPLKFNLSFAVEIVHACIRLHNYCLHGQLPLCGSDTRITAGGIIANAEFMQTGRENWSGLHVNVLREAIRER